MEYLKGMSLTESSQRELKSLVVTLIMLGLEEIARKLQSAADAYQISQQAAVRLAEDTVTNDVLDENTHTLENYMKRLKALYVKALPRLSKALLPPLQVKDIGNERFRFTRSNVSDRVVYVQVHELFEC